MADRAGLLDRFAAFPDRLRAASRAASTRPTPEGEWTPEQIIRHLINVDIEVHQARLRDLADSSDPSWSWQEPGPWQDEPELGLDGVLRRFEETRARTVGTFRALDEPGWARVGRHATYGRLDAEGLLGLATDHDEEHLGGLA
jgi:hypothetical protein